MLTVTELTLLLSHFNAWNQEVCMFTEKTVMR